MFSAYWLFNKLLAWIIHELAIPCFKPFNEKVLRLSYPERRAS